MSTPRDLYGPIKGAVVDAFNLNEDVYVTSLKDTSSRCYFLDPSNRGCYDFAIEGYSATVVHLTGMVSDELFDAHLKKVKHRRQGLFEVCRDITRKLFRSSNDWHVECLDKNVLVSHLDFLSCSKNTRSMPFGLRKGSDLAREQQSIFSSDRSSLHSIRSSEDFTREILNHFHRIVNLSSHPILPATLRPKNSSCLQYSRKDGGTGAFQEDMLRRFLDVRSSCPVLVEMKVILARFNIVIPDSEEDVPLKSILLEDVITYKFISGMNYQTVLFAAAIHYGLHVGCITLDLSTPSGVLFTQIKPCYKGLVIVELAGKFRLVSVSCGVMITIGSYLAACVRSLLLHAPEYTEGYFVDERMPDLFERLNSGGRGSTLNKAIEESRSRSSYVRPMVTDFSSATEYISWKAVKCFGSALRQFSRDMGRFEWMHMVAEYLEYTASPFRIRYEFYDTTVEVNGTYCGLLMGLPMTKEILHFASDLSSCGKDSNFLNRARLILGDDLYLLDRQRFFEQIDKWALQSSTEKADQHAIMVLTDRAFTINWNGSHFELVGANIIPPKNLTLESKFTLEALGHLTDSVSRLVPLKQKLLTIPDCDIALVDTYFKLFNYASTHPYYGNQYALTSGRNAPIEYGGDIWMCPEEVRDFICYRKASCFYVLQSLRKDILFFKSKHGYNWSKYGFIKITDIPNAVSHTHGYRTLGSRSYSDSVVLLQCKKILYDHFDLENPVIWVSVLDLQRSVTLGKWSDFGDFTIKSQILDWSRRRSFVDYGGEIDLTSGMFSRTGSINPLF